MEDRNLFLRSLDIMLFICVIAAIILVGAIATVGTIVLMIMLHFILAIFCFVIPGYITILLVFLAKGMWEKLENEYY